MFVSNDHNVEISVTPKFILNLKEKNLHMWLVTLLITNKTESVIKLGKCEYTIIDNSGKVHNVILQETKRPGNSIIHPQISSQQENVICVPSDGGILTGKYEVFLGEESFTKNHLNFILSGLTSKDSKFHLLPYNKEEDINTYSFNASQQQSCYINMPFISLDSIDSAKRKAN